MRRSLGVSLLLALTALAPSTVAILAAGSWHRVDSPTYSLAQVEAGLRHHPFAWVGRTIRLKAIVTWQPLDCPSGPAPVCQTVSPLTVYSSQILLVHPEPDPFLDRLRSLSALGPLLPRPQPLVGRGIFRVRLQPAPAGSPCGPQPCYWAILPDAGSPP